ncbi:sugar ABC transporter permease [Micrococcales bacterium 31B]|nr:sugar ABC transporter permease [Micrococcales bacterium 31B]
MVLNLEKPPLASPPAPLEPNQRRVSFTPYMLLTPALLAIAVYLAYPLGRQFVMSFQEFGLAQQFGAEPGLVGFANYSGILTSGAFWGTVLRSGLFCLVAASLTMLIGVGGAVLLGRVARPVSLLIQVAMLVAWAMPVMSIMQVFQWLFDARNGLANWLLAQVLGDHWIGYEWLSAPLPFFTIAVLVVIWMSVPLVLFMTYASIQQVDESMVEAARVDGASGRQIFRHIVAPTIAPVLRLVLLLQIIWDLRVFTQVSVLQKSSSITSQTDVLGTFVYNVGVGGGNFGVASAAATLVFLLTMALSWRYVTALRKQGE